jgi:TolB-like protein
VRIAIGDDGKQQRLVKTFSRRGVRFVADVHEIRGGDVGRTAPLVIFADKPSNAVLPFASLGGDGTLASFANGVAEDIITDLSRGSDFSVVSGNSSLRDLSKTDELREVGRQLGVNYLLEDSARTAGRRVRVSARLVDERYDRELKNVFATQESLHARSLRPSPRMSPILKRRGPC